MGYHDLSSCTLNNDERVAEKNKICSILEDVFEQLSPAEAKFVSQIESSGFVSVKQLFWLRDIKDKY